MSRLLPLLLVIALCSGCETVWIVPPASGRVVDARSGQPVSRATITRICTDAPAKTTTHSDGSFRFHGKWHLEVAFGYTLCSTHSYLIEAAGTRA